LFLIFNNMGDSTNPVKFLAKILEKASEGTSIYRVLEGFIAILGLSIISTLIYTTHYYPLLYPISGVISIYGSNHLRRCRNLYQGYLWAIEGMGYRPKNRWLYIAIIRAIAAVEILLIIGGIVLIVSAFTGSISEYIIYILAASTLFFALVAIIGHFTRVKLYRIFIEKVHRDG